MVYLACRRGAEGFQAFEQRCPFGRGHDVQYRPQFALPALAQVVEERAASIAEVQPHLAPVGRAHYAVDEPGGLEPVAQPAGRGRRRGEGVGEGAQVDALVVFENEQHSQLGGRGGSRRGAAPEHFQELRGR